MYIYFYIYIYIYRHYAFAATFNPNNKNVFPLIQTAFKLLEQLR